MPARPALHRPRSHPDPWRTAQRNSAGITRTCRRPDRCPERASSTNYTRRTLPLQKLGRNRIQRASNERRVLCQMVLEETDKDLLEGCQRGEPEALRALFERHKDKVYSIAVRYSGDRTAAMDIAQD